MATYTVEKTYLLPNYRHVTLDADSPAEAARLALADDNDSADWKHDYDCARPEEVTGVWIGEEAYNGEACPLPESAPVAPPSEDKAREAIAAALALDSEGQRSVYFALEKALNYFPCVILQADDVLDETREGLEDKGAEPYERELATTLTIEQARLAAGSVTEDDWSDTVGEAQWRARQRLLKIARADLAQTA